MRVAITGSIATDHLMVYPGRFAEHFIADKLDRLSLSFLVDRLDIRRGGAAANICFGMGMLGLRPALVGAAGHDFADYRSWLERHGVDTGSVRVSQTKFTARFLCTTDDYHNQIASFYSGAMAEAREIELAPVAARTGGLDLVVIAPNDPAAMVRHTEECRDRGYVFAADPSQQLARMTPHEIRTLVTGATYLFTNEYERDLLLSRTKWTAGRVLDEVGTWITTLGEQGARIESAAGEVRTVTAAKVTAKVDPTGAGDAFRAGFLAGRSWGLAVDRSAQIGCALASVSLASLGSQEYEVDAAGLLARFSAAYGPVAAAEVSPHLPGNIPAAVVGQ
ncbi:carbohydrate kinase family protein [Kibdelosporangium phytohabitans]|uniref:Ribokinase n=1 Tax=Kibdelosporangium phytohabitans TaxID=860235 RepID=A0A0N9I553_9PSEU|nr:carbohydrate kinase family protein [Kibdelosporangium phytohabitans]ALG09973.1 ribokinase [Kibdelosporangium phytohabitans]MBE1468611.1 adenosine kinase [Kibdelosporangium phytohabitans]